MTLHPQARAALAGLDSTLPTVEQIPAVRRENDLSARMSGGPPTPVPVVVDVELDADTGVRGRLYDPRNGHGAPVLIYLHGGGWVFGSLETVDGLCRRIAHRSGCAVLSVAYRLAPEHHWPAPVEDVDAAVAWLHRNAEAHGLDASRLAVAGDSAGGNLAAVAARRARDAGRPFAFQALTYPVIDPVAGSTSAADPETGAEHGLSAAEMAFFWNSYLPADADRKHPDIAPLCADSLADLPPALVITAEYDVLRDEGERYALALAEAGVPVVLARYQGMIHSFARQLGVFDAALAAADQLAGAVREALDPPR